MQRRREGEGGSLLAAAGECTGPGSAGSWKTRIGHVPRVDDSDGLCPANVRAGRPWGPRLACQEQGFRCAETSWVELCGRSGEGQGGRAGASGEYTGPGRRGESKKRCKSITRNYKAMIRNCNALSGPGMPQRVERGLFNSKAIIRNYKAIISDYKCPFGTAGMPPRVKRGVGGRPRRRARRHTHTHTHTNTHTHILAAGTSPAPFGPRVSGAQCAVDAMQHLDAIQCAIDAI